MELSLVLLSLYMMTHGACLVFAFRAFRQMDWDDFHRHTDKPLYFRLEPILRGTGFLFGPVGIVLFLIIFALIPDRNKAWLE